MKNKLQAKAQAIDSKKDKIVLAGITLVVGLMALAIFSSNVKAEDQKVQTKPIGQWDPHLQVQDDVKLPLKLKTQKFGH